MADAVPVTGRLPAAESVTVDGAPLTEQHQQMGLIVVAGDQCPAGHGAAVDRVAQGGHGGGWDGGGGGGGAHRFRFG